MGQDLSPRSEPPSLWWEDRVNKSQVTSDSGTTDYRPAHHAPSQDFFTFDWQIAACLFSDSGVNFSQKPNKQNPYLRHTLKSHICAFEGLTEEECRYQGERN